MFTINTNYFYDRAWQLSREEELLREEEMRKKVEYPNLT